MILGKRSQELVLHIGDSVAYVTAGPRTRLNHLYSLYRRFRVSATQATTLLSK